MIDSGDDPLEDFAREAEALVNLTSRMLAPFRALPKAAREKLEDALKKREADALEALSERIVEYFADR